MTWTTLAGFSLAMLILAASPGPGVCAVISRSLASGFRKSLFTITGIVTGDLIYLIFAIFGLTYLARNMGEVFRIIRILGGTYLIFLGVKTFLAKVEPMEGEKKKQDVSGFSAYMSGLLITLSNPKAILFYCGFLPAFVDLEYLTVRDGSFISLLVIGILGSVMTLYALLASGAARFAASPKGRKRLNRGAGGIMTAAGALLILKN